MQDNIFRTVRVKRTSLRICIQGKPLMWLILASLSLLTLQVSAEAASSTCVRDSRVIEIPTGAFSMGSDRAERDYGYRIGSHAARRWHWFDNWELPHKRVALPEYFIDKNLTTQAEYRRFVWASGHRAPFISPENYKHQGYLVHSYESVASLSLGEKQRRSADIPERSSESSRRAHKSIRRAGPLRLAGRKSSSAIPAAHGSGMGKGGAWRRRQIFSMGQHLRA